MERKSLAEGSTLDLLTELVMGLGMAPSTGPLAFVATAAAKRQGILAKHRRLLGRMFVAALMAGALLGAWCFIGNLSFYGLISLALK
jgi:hypothetical protein